MGVNPCMINSKYLYMKYLKMGGGYNWIEEYYFC